MLISPVELRRFFGISPRAVLHIGAHTAEELGRYIAAHFGPRTWIEAQPDLIEGLREKVSGVGDKVVEACIWSVSGKELTFHRTNNGESSSVYEMGTHKNHHPHVHNVETYQMVTKALEDILPLGSEFDFVNIDIQGAELQALMGMGKLLDSVQWIYLETNREELYEGIPLAAEVEEWLVVRGFVRAVSIWTEYEWGDSLFVRVGRRPRLQKVCLAASSWAIVAWIRLFPLRKALKKARKLLQFAVTGVYKNSKVLVVRAFALYADRFRFKLLLARRTKSQI